MKLGDMVISNYGFTGIIIEQFDNWGHLKTRCEFITIDQDRESEKMSFVEKLISGDPKDEWLKLQDIPFTKDQLNEKWFTVRCIDGGAIWSCESRLELINQN